MLTVTEGLLGLVVALVGCFSSSDAEESDSSKGGEDTNT